MTPRALSLLLLAVAAAAGCSSANLSGGKTGGKSDASPTGWGGMSGSGGNTVVILMDAAAASDGSGQSPVNLSSDAPVFVRDAQGGGAGGTPGTGSGGTSGTGVAGAGGSAAGGMVSGTGGNAAGTSGRGGSAGAGSGGTMSSGGRAGSGGVSGRGGATGPGGMTSMGGATGGGGVRVDAGVPPRDASVATDSPPAAIDGGALDAMIGAPDLRPADTAPSCVARLRSIIPMTDNLPEYLLVAGADVKIVLRAEVVSGGPAAPTWTWQGYFGSNPIAADRGKEDPAAAAFSIAQAGAYTFRATAGTSCLATMSVVAAAPGSCPTCDRTVIVRSAPPAASDIPVQTGAWTFGTAGPYVLDFKLVAGERVFISPSLGGSLVRSYVRINNAAGELVTDGLANPPAAFASVLVQMADGNLLGYDVLVVPLDGANGDTVAATAPQIFPNLTTSQMTGFPLSGGLTVSGNIQKSTGEAVADARVILTNHNPALPEQKGTLVFSSVGRADAGGNYTLHAQPGQYWVSIAPPVGSGLAETLTTDAITLTGNANISFRWNAIEMATLLLDVRDANGLPADGARVRLTSAQTTTVGTLTVDGAPRSASGNVRTEATTAGGSATFANLPAGATYYALISPPLLGPSAATTLTTVTVPPGGTAAPVPLTLVRQGSIAGNLTSVVAGTDFTKVKLVAYDQSADTPEAPQAVLANADGSFAIGVSPGRGYVVLAVPDTAATALARTFVGPGIMQAAEFVVRQQVPKAMPWTGRVMDPNNRGLAGTALQVFCGASWPGCVDPSLPLAETTAEYDGAFQLALPDPATR